jgi:hypothetical protein
MTTCTMPGCTRPPTTNNRAQQPTCAGHKTVVVSGSWMGEGVNHLEPREDCQ